MRGNPDRLTEWQFVLDVSSIVVPVTVLAIWIVHRPLAIVCVIASVTVIARACLSGLVIDADSVRVVGLFSSAVFSRDEVTTYRWEPALPFYGSDCDCSPLAVRSGRSRTDEGPAPSGWTTGSADMA